MDMAEDSFHVAIAGGGIAGLALALNLHSRGVPCTVYEAVDVVGEIGVGITLLPHAMRELTALGLADEVGAVGIENRESLFFNRFGQRIYAEPRGRHAGYPFPEYGIHRGRLHRLLYDAVRERLGEAAVVTGARATGVVERGERVFLQLERDGDAVETAADAVVACDGIQSAIRRQFYPDERVAFTGINTWRGVTRRPPIFDGRTYLRIGSLSHCKMVIYPIVDDVDRSGLQLINWVAEVQTGRDARNDWNQAGRLDDFQSHYADWRFDWLDVPALIREADRVLEYPMVDKDPVSRWTFGRTTFAGDAAHPMYPRGSNGSAQALIDVRVLADRLAGSRDVRAAFAAYENERREPTAKIVLTNRTMPPDFISMRVEELTGDRPFADLETFVTQDELRALSDRYKQLAGFTVADVGPGSTRGEAGIVRE
jgi:2-polyprenyl-6-methoxyphenol hydroxylase-like FAD-dependent oxidoreductase